MFSSEVPIRPGDDFGLTALAQRENRETRRARMPEFPLLLRGENPSETVVIAFRRPVAS
jgi:hypothetical protein